MGLIGLLLTCVAAEHACLAAACSFPSCFFFRAFCAAALVADLRSSAADLRFCCCEESLGLPAHPYRQPCDNVISGCCDTYKHKLDSLGILKP